MGFVNGLPFTFVELKRNDVDVENAYKGNYTDYLDTISHLFYCNAFVMLSNGTSSKIGTIGSPWEFFNEWKRLVEAEAGKVDFPTMLRGVCKRKLHRPVGELLSFMIMQTDVRQRLWLETINIWV